MIDAKIIFGNNIKLLRQKLKISQDVFVEKIGISPTTLSLIESGKNFTTSETINKICNEFSIPLSALFETDSYTIEKTFGNRKQVVNDIVLILNNLDDGKLLLTADYIEMLSNSNFNVKMKKPK